MMNGNKLERSVLPLPTELRLEIYRHLVCKTYLAVHTIPERCIVHPSWSNRHLTVSPGLVILRVSKATCSEALKLLYDESVFVFKIDFATPFSYDFPPQNAVPLMSNVSFEISAKIEFPNDTYGGHSPPEEGPSKQDMMSQRTIEQFTGNTYLRNVARIRFIGWFANTQYCIPPVFLEALEDLGGFQTLVFSLEFPRTGEPYNPPLPLIECDGYKDVFQSHGFESIYGPAVQHAVHGASSYICYLAFHPRQYSAKQY